MTDTTLEGPGFTHAHVIGQLAEVLSSEPPPSLDSGLVCLIKMARFHGLAADGDQLAHEFGDTSSTHARFQTQTILLAAKKRFIEEYRGRLPGS